VVDVIQSYTGGDYGRTATQNAQPFKGIVIHVAGKPDLQSELNYSSHQDPNRGGYYGYHYLIDRDGSVYQTAPDNVRTNHILPNSQYGLNNSNALGVSFIGGAPAGKDPLPLTPGQINSGTQLVNNLKQQYGINTVINHGALDASRSAGHHLGPDDSAEGADFMAAYNKNQPATTQPAVTTPAQPAQGTTINTTTAPPASSSAFTFDPTGAAAARKYLSGLSAHPGRPGDTANFNPEFAARLGNAIRQARAAGLPVGLESGFREPGQTGSAYDAGGNSSHSYGLAGDVSGLDGANGKITQAWAQIAAANGLNNPYGIGDKDEFNHWQLPPQPLEKSPQLLTSLQTAKATGNFQNVWNAYQGSAAAPAGTGTNATAGGKYTNDQVFNALFGQESSYGRNPRAGGNVLQIQPGTWAQYAQPGENINNRTDNMAVGRRIVDDYMGRYGGDPSRVATAYFSGAGNVAPAGSANPFLKDTTDASKKTTSSYVADVMGRLGAPAPAAAPAVAGTTLNTSGAPATAAGGGTLPGFGTTAASNQFTQGVQTLDKAMGGSGQAPGQGGGPPQMQAPPMPPPPPARGVSPLLQMPQVYGQTINSLADPQQWAASHPGLQWGQGPPGVSPIPSMQPGQAPQLASTAPMGTSLNAMQQLQMLSNPMYQQMMGGGYYG
jgi:hypothetical protein